MYDRIVVPLDGSDLASEALVHGKNLAKRLDVPIHLVRAIDPTVFSGGMGAIGMGFDYTAVNELIWKRNRTPPASSIPRLPR